MAHLFGGSSRKEKGWKGSHAFLVNRHESDLQGGRTELLTQDYYMYYTREGGVTKIEGRSNAIY